MVIGSSSVVGTVVAWHEVSAAGSATYDERLRGGVNPNVNDAATFRGGIPEAEMGDVAFAVVANGVFASS